MLGLIKSFVLFYTTSQPVEILSRYDLVRSLSLIQQLNKQEVVRVRCTKNKHIIVASAQAGPRANILPIFEGELIQQSNHVILRGRIGIDPGIRVVIGVFCFLIFIYLPLRLGILLGATTHVAPSAGYIAPLVLIGLLVFFFLSSRSDSVKIFANLRRVLNENANN